MARRLPEGEDPHRYLWLTVRDALLMIVRAIERAFDLERRS